MQIRELMTANPDACLAGDSCAIAIGIMRRRNCGFVPVVESYGNKHLLGVLTDRDIALRLGQINRPASEVRVAECMTRQVKCIAPDTGLEEAAALMEQFAIHRLPVVEEERLVGVLSLKDLAVAADKRWAYSGSKAVEQKLGEIVEAIASAR